MPRLLFVVKYNYKHFEDLDNSAIKHNFLIHVFRSSLKSTGKLIIVYVTMHNYDGMCKLSINYYDRLQCCVYI